MVDQTRVDGLEPKADGTVNGFRIAFKAKKTLKPEPNTCELRIWNLSERTRGLMSKQYVPVVIVAGYEEGDGIIFQGKSRTVDHMREGTDWVTRIRCGDGEMEYQFSRFSDSFGKGATAPEVAKKIIGALGVGAGNALTEVKKKSVVEFARGFAAHGNAAGAFDQLTRKLGLTWSIQDGQIQVLDGSQPAAGTAVLLTPETGLVGSPEHNAPDLKGGPALSKAKSLLNAAIKCGRTVAIQSAQVNGQFRVESVEHDGDTAGQNWYTTIEFFPFSSGA
jgi:hypothetical protein